MRRVTVIGASGNGKTTLSRTLAERLDVPWIELDALHHGPNWSEPDPDEFRARVDAATSGDGWVVDGNYEAKLGDLVVARADAIVWLDLPLHTVMRRLWTRTIHRLRTREELWNGNRESFRGAFLGTRSLFAWTVRAHFRHRRSAPKRLQGRNLVRLRSPGEVDRFLREVS